MYKIDDASFRDPKGYVIHHNNNVFRVINNSYKEEYEHCTKSGLFKKLIDEGLLLLFEESSDLEIDSKEIFKILEQKKLNFISYPYEWSFDMLKDAALATLKIQKICIEYGASLKDASSYNIQFHEGKPVFIDITSFEIFEEKPWIAYRQFCEHFLGPLALMAKKDVRLSSMLVNYIDGMPLDIISSIIPKTTFTNFGLATHLHAHAKAQKKYEGEKIEKKKLGKMQLLGIVESLTSTIKNLKLEQKTEWADYYDDTNYTTKAEKNKVEIVKKYINNTNTNTIIDFGANDGKYSKIAAEKSFVISVDKDPIAVNNNYKNQNSNMISIIGDLSNPIPSIGWNNLERPSFLERIGKSTCMALALIHHLRITFGIPLSKQFELFSKIAENLIIEFIDKKDSQIIRLLQNREDVFDDLTEENFEKIASQYFTILDNSVIRDTNRKIYLMKNKNSSNVSKD